MVSCRSGISWPVALSANFHNGPDNFRRVTSTELIRGGANLYPVKELLGHENLEILKHDTALTIEDLKATLARSHPRERGRSRDLGV